MSPKHTLHPGVKTQHGTQREAEYRNELARFYDSSSYTTLQRLANFPLYVPRQEMARYLCRYELFKKVIGVHGSVVECGVGFGGGLMAFAQFSAIFEPVNYTRSIIGFDSFRGFPRLTREDRKSTSWEARPGGLAADSLKELATATELYDMNRFLGHLPKVELVKGNATRTIPRFLERKPHFVCSLLYMDFDIYQPTKVALENFYPRMPKGAVIAFDEVNVSDWPGETIAVMKELGLRNLRLERFPFEPTLSFAVL